MRRTAAVAAAAAVVLASGLTLAAPAAAKAPRKSATFAGYDVESKHVRSATATFVIPHITCKSKLSGVGPAVILDSKKNIFSGAGVGVTCQAGQPVFESDLIVNNHQHVLFRLSAGDRVRISVHETKKKKSSVTLHDLTAKRSRTLTGKGRTMTFAEIGAQSVAFGHRSVGVDPFSPTHFHHVLVNGRSLTKEAAFPVERINKGHRQIAVGKIIGGKSFTLTFKHS
ncbi:MAG TPA: G1 family glutamic endopeptidase [Mycobacteriales bacterium]|nr:G1 family glutamic endopeptidase [Mycobacteriales bacterium]